MEIRPISLETQVDFLRCNAVSNELMIIPKRGSFYGLYNGEELVGSIGYIKYSKHFKIDCHYIKREYRKQGWGETLFNFMFSQLQSRDIIAYATEDSINFYLKNGFVIEKKYKRTYLVKRKS